MKIVLKVTKNPIESGFIDKNVLSLKRKIDIEIYGESSEIKMIKDGEIVSDVNVIQGDIYQLNLESIIELGVNNIFDKIKNVTTEFWRKLKVPYESTGK